MDAKMLRDKYANDLFLPLPLEQLEEIRLKIRALDLLVAVEESEYEMVLDLLAAAKLHRLAICYKAAAALVAMKAAKEKAEAERDELKRHAEAMAEELQWIACRYDDSKSTRECAADAYEMKSAAAQALHAYRATQEKS